MDLSIHGEGTPWSWTPYEEGHPWEWTSYGEGHPMEQESIGRAPYITGGSMKPDTLWNRASMVLESP